MGSILAAYGLRIPQFQSALRQKPEITQLTDVFIKPVKILFGYFSFMY